MSILDKLFGREKMEPAEPRPVEADPTLQLTGEEYWQAMELEQLGLSQEDRDLICGYYDKWRASPADCPVRPVGREEYLALQDVLDLDKRCMLWTDDESNYAGVYYGCPLAGKVMFLVHDDPLYAPLYHSVGSFLRSVENGGVDEGIAVPSLVRDTERYPADYPARRMSPDDAAANLELAKRLLARAADEPDAGFQAHFVLMAAYLMPPEHLDLLLPLLEGESRYFQQDLPRVFVFHRYRPAIPVLQRAAQESGVYLKENAKRALKWMGDGV